MSIIQMRNVCVCVRERAIVKVERVTTATRIDINDCGYSNTNRRRKKWSQTTTVTICSLAVKVHMPLTFMVHYIYILLSYSINRICCLYVHKRIIMTVKAKRMIMAAAKTMRELSTSLALYLALSKSFKLIYRVNLYRSCVRVSFLICCCCFFAPFFSHIHSFNQSISEIWYVEWDQPVYQN